MEAEEGSPGQALSGEDMFALATDLLPSLLQQQTHRIFIPGFQGKVGYPIPDTDGEMMMLINVVGMKSVAGWVRAERPDLRLTDACTYGVALALLSLGSRTWLQQGTQGELRVEGSDNPIVVSEEAVAAFYATLHSNCVVRKLRIEGAAFGTPAAAAHLGRCLNLNSALRHLKIMVGGETALRIRRGSGSCWGEAAWTALSEALTSNASIEEVNVLEVPAGISSHVSATFASASQKLSALRTFWLIQNTRSDADAPAAARATLGGIEGWGHVLKDERCTLTQLDLDLLLPAQGGLVAICEALLTNTTLERLTIGPSYGYACAPTPLANG